jgi:hypothetical protein
MSNNATNEASHTDLLPSRNKLKAGSPVSLHVALAKRFQASTSILGYSQYRSQASKIAKETEA